MEILIKDKLKNLCNIINKKAKYQKVLLVYDNSISNLEINNIFASIKEICIFNKMEIDAINEEEYYNGYRCVIFLCSGQSMLDFKYNKEDFINIYIPTDNLLTPFFSNNFNVLCENCFLLTDNSNISTILLGSCYFNTFCSYAENIINGLNNFNTTNLPEHITMFSLVEYLNNQKFIFKDLEILKYSKVPLKSLPLVELVIIDAFILLFSSINQNQFSFVDFVKVSNSDYNLIDKFYSRVFNENIYNSISLNFNNLTQMALSTKTHILKCLKCCEYLDENNLNTTINKIKNHLKDRNDIFNYLYIFNIFGN